VSILVSRINVNLDEQATLLGSLHDLKHHEEVYWSWQLRRIRLDRSELNKICHKISLPYQGSSLPASAFPRNPRNSHITYYLASLKQQKLECLKRGSRSPI
jgi:hypothetical protein